MPCFEYFRATERDRERRRLRGVLEPPTPRPRRLSHAVAVLVVWILAVYGALSLVWTVTS